MSKILVIDTCQGCFHATEESVADYSPLCEYDEIHRALNEDYTILSDCPLPDSKGQGWQDIETELSSLVDKWKAMNTVLMRQASYLLPEPGGMAVRQCLDEIERLNTRTEKKWKYASEEEWIHTQGWLDLNIPENTERLFNAARETE